MVLYHSFDVTLSGGCTQICITVVLLSVLKTKRQTTGPHLIIPSESALRLIHDCLRPFIRNPLPTNTVDADYFGLRFSLFLCLSV